MIGYHHVGRDGGVINVLYNKEIYNSKGPFALVENYLKKSNLVPVHVKAIYDGF